MQLMPLSHAVRDGTCQQWQGVIHNNDNNNAKASCLGVDPGLFPPTPEPDTLLPNLTIFKRKRPEKLTPIRAELTLPYTCRTG